MVRKRSQSKRPSRKKRVSRKKKRVSRKKKRVSRRKQQGGSVICDNRCADGVGAHPRLKTPFGRKACRIKCELERPGEDFMNRILGNVLKD